MNELDYSMKEMKFIKEFLEKRNFVSGRFHQDSFGRISLVWQQDCGISDNNIYKLNLPKGITKNLIDLLKSAKKGTKNERK